MKNLYIEITDACNLRCSFCPSKARRDFMPTALFEKCVAGATEIGAENVYFHVLGEPTLHPGFSLFVKHLESTPLKLTLVTNGTTIARTGRAILESPAVRQVNFSTHAFAELPPDDARGHLQDVFDFCKMALAMRPDLYINLRLWNIGDSGSGSWNSYMLGRIRETFGVEVNPGNFCSRHKSFPIEGRLYLHEDSRFEWPGAGTASSASNTQQIVHGTCHALETHAAILHDGRVVACCLDHSGQITLGNINEQGLAEILGSPAARNIREGFEKHELRHPFCQGCGYCRRFK